jgi:hypothetical protein
MVYQQGGYSLVVQIELQKNHPCLQRVQHVSGFELSIEMFTALEEIQ